MSDLSQIPIKHGLNGVGNVTEEYKNHIIENAVNIYSNITTKITRKTDVKK